MSITTQQRVQGLTTYQKFLSSLAPGEYFFQEKNEDNSFGYWPIEVLFQEVPPNAPEWEMKIIINWVKEGKALITRTVPSANVRAVVHKSLLPHDIVRYLTEEAE
jgi:hypothetical protein